MSESINESLSDRVSRPIDAWPREKAELPEGPNTEFFQFDFFYHIAMGKTTEL